MRLIKVAAGVLNQTPLDWQGNQAHIVEAIERARDEGVAILCLPELCISGYGCEDAFLSPGVQRVARQVLAEVVPTTRGMAVSVGLPLAYHNALYNVAALLVDGRIAGFVAKQYLAGDGIHYEPRWFRPWPAGHRGEVQFDGLRYPLGDVCFDVGGVRIGFEICEDAWVANRPGGELAQRGVDVILNPSASHFAFGKSDVRHRFVLEGSRAFGVTYVYANLVGNEAGRAIYDGGGLIAAAGQLVAAGPRFSFADVQVTSAVVDVDLTRMRQAQSSRYDAALDGGATYAVAPIELPVAAPVVADVRLPAWETAGALREEEFGRAVALGLLDYLRKSRSQGFVVSLSGGADSSAITCLVWLMVQLGTRELGLDGLARKLAYRPATAGAQTPDQLLHGLLTCVYQATDNSGDVTRNAAREVAQAVGAEFLEFQVQPLVDGYLEIVSLGIGRELSWLHDDLALQNIQARVRSPSVWLLANLRGALLLSTSNRSEAAVGYATMDGDTSGGLSPIAGIDKAFLRRWLRWLETTGPAGLRPLPALAAVNRQAPTAELRPPGAGQTDEADLMPYDVLDAVERLAIRDKLTPLEVLLQLRPRYQQHSVPQLAEWIERFFRLWCRNQWKRERYAPSFHVDDENLDPKTWCRFPILSGGYERELAELRAYVSAR